MFVVLILCPLANVVKLKKQIVKLCQNKKKTATYVNTWEYKFRPLCASLAHYILMEYILMCLITYGTRVYFVFGN